MKKTCKISILLCILYANNIVSQGCWSANSQYAEDYCCGHDPEFVGQSIHHQMLVPHHSVNGIANFCDDGNYDFVTINSASSLSENWFLVWNDDFNYGTLDESFYQLGMAFGYGVLEKCPGKGIITRDNIV